MPLEQLEGRPVDRVDRRVGARGARPTSASPARIPSRRPAPSTRRARLRVARARAAQRARTASSTTPSTTSCWPASGRRADDRYPTVAAFADALLPHLGDPAAGLDSLADLVEQHAEIDPESAEDPGWERLGLWDRLQGPLGFGTAARRGGGGVGVADVGGALAARPRAAAAARGGRGGGGRRRLRAHARHGTRARSPSRSACSRSSSGSLRRVFAAGCRRLVVVRRAQEQRRGGPARSRLRCWRARSRALRDAAAGRLRAPAAARPARPRSSAACSRCSPRARRARPRPSRPSTRSLRRPAAARCSQATPCARPSASRRRGSRWPAGRSRRVAMSLLARRASRMRRSPAAVLGGAGALRRPTSLAQQAAGSSGALPRSGRGRRSSLSLAGSLILMGLVAALGAPLRAEEETLIGESDRFSRRRR